MIIYMMGNESSQLSGLEIEDKATDITDFWSHHKAAVNDSCRYFSTKSDGSVSVLKGEAVLGPLWTVSTPLEKYSNNLLKYRHPCIVRYLSSWQQRSTLHLATEYVQPLSHVLSLQTPLQICIGLNNILRALVFLHEQGKMSHNNVSVSAVYVSGDGQWKLGGLQYLCSFGDLTSTYLKHARIHRYDKAVDPNEDSYELTAMVDQYGFAVLVEDVFKGHMDDEVPHLREFKKYCKDSLQHPNPKDRPNLSEVLRHNFFNHEFISIYKFLNFLPLKTDEEKNIFFSNILDRLKYYDEETVAKQLSGLLLSRLTLLDATARRDVIPFILRPKTERQNEENTGFFSLSTFKEHLKPRLMQLFGVHDSQIRMLLLMHFSKFVHVFTHEELSQQILPELLLGMKDTDDNLVASTLMCLSELVPILGGDTVIGGNRSKFFTDGRPNSMCELNGETVSQTPRLHDVSNTELFQNTSIGISNYNKEISLNERPSPVGGESINLEPNDIVPDSEDDWSDWENSNRQLTTINSCTTIEDIEKRNILLTDNKNGDERKTDLNPTPNIKTNTNTMLLQKAALEAKKNIVDISELDIKNQKIEKRNGEEFDFFADMMPVIEKPTVMSVAHTASDDISSKLNFVPVEDENGEGWGEDWN